MVILKRPWIIGLTALMSLMFAVFAYVQLNDIDPEVYHKPSAVDVWSWVIFYSLLAVLSAASIFWKVPRVWLVLAAVFCLFEMVRTGPGLWQNLFQAEKFTMTGASMSPTRSEVELSREFFGALIGLAGVGFLWWQSTRAPREARSSS